MTPVSETGSAFPSSRPATLRPGYQRELPALLAVGRRPDVDDPRATQQAAGQLVGQLFFAPLLAEMRKLPFGQALGTGGRTEEVFGEQLDLRIADAVAAADGGGLTAAIARRLRPRGAAATAPAEEGVLA